MKGGKTGATTGSVRQGQVIKDHVWKIKDSRLCLVGDGKPFNMYVAGLLDQEIQNGRNLQVVLKVDDTGPKTGVKMVLFQ